jgi:glycosyltransferase involved in cell wall biosynthesis
MPEVSVVIPSYNHASFIGEAVRSVLAQSFADLELIVVDDGSSDQSLQVLAGFKDPRLHVFQQENRGAHAAINRGLQQASGKFLAILNSDDAYHPQRLEKMVSTLKSDPQVGLISSYITAVDGEGRTVGIKHGYKDSEPWLLDAPGSSFRAGTDLVAVLHTVNFLATTSNFVFSRSCYEQVGDFLPLRYTHDWDFALRAVRGFSLKLFSEPLLRYRMHNRNTIRENQAAMIFEICWILAVHLPTFTLERSAAEKDPGLFVRQLLNSVYTYDCDRVLNVLLLKRLDENPQAAARLLEATDAERIEFIKYIQQRVNEAAHNEIRKNGGESPNQRHATPSLWRRGYRYLRRRMDYLRAGLNNRRHH